MRASIAAALLLCFLAFDGLPAQARSEPDSLVDVDPLPLPRKVETRWGRDPFFLAGVRAQKPRETEAQPLAVSAIIFRPGRAVAIINDRIVRTGEAVDGRRVSEILPDRVILREGGRMIELRVNRFEAK